MFRSPSPTNVESLLQGQSGQFASGDLRLLQMVLKPDTERCASGDAGSQRDGLWDPHWLERGTEYSL